MTDDEQAMATSIAVKMVGEFMDMMRRFPDFAWDSSGSVCILSDGIAAAIAARLGTNSLLDGPGVDIPQLNLEVTAGHNIAKSHGIKVAASFLWIRRFNKKWHDGFEVRIGDFTPEDFPTTKQGKHGSSVPKSIALSRTSRVFHSKESHVQ